MRISLIVLLIPALLLLGWLSWGSAEPRADFVLATEEPRTLDPHRASWLNELQVADALFEGLTRLNPQTLHPEPGVAESWSFTEDHRTCTFQLRESARWSNSDPVRAEDFLFSWLRVLDPRTESQYAAMLFIIEGAKAYHDSRTTADETDDLPANSVGIEVLGEHTLRIRLAVTCSYLLELTAFPALFPVHRPTIEKFAYRDGVVLRSTRHLWTRPENIVCNGPYTIADWQFKKRILLRRNTLYSGAARAALDTVEVLIAPDPNIALRAYESGRVDFVRDVPATIAQALFREVRAGRRSDFHIGDRFSTYFYRANCRRPPLDQPAFRRALSLAIDRDALCVQVTGMGETPALTYVPAGSVQWMARDSGGAGQTIYQPPRGLGAGKTYAERLAWARAELTQSGFDPRSREIELMFAPNPAYQRVAEALAAMWERDLGLRITLRTIEGKVLSERVRALDYDLVRSDWSGDYLDPMTFLEMFTTDNGQNRTGWSNPDYDAAIAAAVMEADDARRFDLLHAAERILCEQELPILPLYHRRGNFLLRTGYQGITDNIREYFPLYVLRRSLDSR